MRRTVAAILLAGTAAGVGLCAAATLLYAVGSPQAVKVALLGVLALFGTPPLRLAAVARGFMAEREPRLALAALAVLSVLVAIAARAAYGYLL